MIAASVKDADRVVDILLARGADVNQTSMSSHPSFSLIRPYINHPPQQTTTAKYTYPSPPTTPTKPQLTPPV